MKLTDKTNTMLTLFIGAAGAALLIGCSDKAQVKAPVKVQPQTEHRATLGEVLQQRTDNGAAQAEPVYTAAPGLTPAERYNLALGFINNGRAAQAEIELIQVCADWPAFSKPFKNLARAQLKLGKPKDALAHAMKAAGLNPADGSIDNVIGLAFMDMHQHDSAADFFRSAVQKSPDYVWAYNNLGYLHILQGRYDEAKTVLTEGAKMGGAPAALFNNLGVALEQTGDIEGALVAFRGAVAVQPGNAKATAAIARLEPLAETKADQTIAQIPVTSDTPAR